MKSYDSLHPQLHVPTTLISSCCLAPWCLSLSSLGQTAVCVSPGAGGLCHPGWSCEQTLHSPPGSSHACDSGPGPSFLGHSGRRGMKLFELRFHLPFFSLRLSNRLGISLWTRLCELKNSPMSSRAAGDSPVQHVPASGSRNSPNCREICIEKALHNPLKGVQGAVYVVHN